MKNAGNLVKIKAYCDAINFLAAEEALTSDINILTEAIRSHADIGLSLELRHLDEMAIFFEQKRAELMAESRIKFFKLHSMNETELNHYGSMLDGIVDWQFPCLDLFPGTGNILKSVVGAEPLYIADWDDEVLLDVSNQFNSIFAEKRLMKYKISKYDMTPLPQKTFGLVYSLNWSMFENIDNLEEMSKSVYNLLMPGGCFLFNYNPLDKWWGIDQYGDIKGYYGAYTNELKTLIRNIGFKIVRLNREPGQLSFMLCRKQGELNHVKLSSTLAKIIEKDVELL